MDYPQIASALLDHLAWAEIDDQGVVRTVSPEFCNLTARSSHQWVGTILVANPDQLYWGAGGSSCVESSDSAAIRHLCFAVTIDADQSRILRLRLVPLSHGQMGYVAIAELASAATGEHEEYRHFFDHAIDLMCIANEDGFFTRTNPAFATTLGYAPNELVSQPFLNFVHPDDVEPTLAEVVKLQQGMTTTRFRNRYRCSDGSWKWLSWRVHPVPSLGIQYATARDVTSLHQHEQDLLRAQRRLSTITDHVTAWLSESTPEGVITAVHASTLDLHEGRPDSPVGAGIADLACFAHTPETREVVQAAVDRARAGVPSRLDLELWTGAGTAFIDLRLAPIRGTEGEIEALLVSGLDITQLKLAEIALKRANEELEQRVAARTEAVLEREAQLRAFLANVPGVVFLCDCEPPWRVTLMSAAVMDLTGWTADDFLNERIHKMDLVEPEDRLKLLRAVTSASRSASRYSCEYRIRTRDRELRWVKETGRITIDTHGAARLEAHLVDITESRRLNEALSQELERVSDLYHNAPCGYHSIDRTLRVVSMNRTEMGWLGYSPEEILGTMLLPELLTEDAWRVFQSAMDDLSPERPFPDLELEMRRKDGSTFPARLHSTARFGPNGEFLEARSTVFNVTVRKELTLALADSERFNRATLDALSAHVAVLNANGEILATNSAWKRFAEENSGDWRAVSEGVNYLDVCDRAMQGGCADAELAAGAIRRLLTEAADIPPFEYPCHSSEKERWFSCSITRFPGGGGARVVVAHEDVTVARQAQAASERSQKLFRDFFELAPDSMMIIDANGHITRANREAEQLFGWPANELVGLSVDDLLPHRFRERHAELRRQFLAVGTARSMGEGGTELIALTRDGREVPLAISLTPLHTDEGPVIAAALRDISERRKQEEDLRARELAEHANEAKSAFLAAMSHEIRTPMNGVIGMIELLSQCALDEDAREMVQTVRESSFGLLGIIDAILDFSKLESGRMELESAPVDLGELLEAVAENLRAFARSRGVDLRLFVDPSLPERVLTDALRVRQILNNLIGNGIKFSATSGKQGRVSARITAGPIRDGSATIIISVSDNGVGIAPRDQSRLFHPFAQADTSTSRRFGGTGLGLSITHRIVEQMGGCIQVDSDVGLGANFTVMLNLPVAEGEVHPVRQPLQGVVCCLSITDPLLSADLGAYILAWGGQVQQPSESRGDQETVLITDAAQVTEPSLGRVPTVTLVQNARSHYPHPVSGAVVTVDTSPLHRSSFVDAIGISLGRAPQVKRPAPAQESLGLGSPPPEHYPLLVVEDNETNQQVIIRQLKLLGYRAELAPNGRRALEMWRRNRYSLVLSDLHMPNMDGFALVEAIRAEEGEGDRIPFIAFTANVLPDSRLRGLRDGMDGFLTKPVQLPKLKAVLDTWITHDRARGQTQTASDEAWDASNAESDSFSALPVLDIDVLRQLVGPDPTVIEELLRDFLVSAQRGVEAVEYGAASRDLTAVASAAHKLKSAARAIGALRLGELSAKLERAGNSDDAASVSGLLGAFLRQWEAVRREVDRELDSS